MNALKLDVYVWKPLLFSSETLTSFVLIILNRPIKCDRNLMMSMWRRASIKVLVDGGANQWFEFLRAGNISVSEKSIIPDFVTGDLDSVSQDVLNHFKSLGAKIVHTPDQNETDFTKALRVLAEQRGEEMSQVEAVISVVETNGRFDQIMANINTLYKAREIVEAPVYLLTSDSITWLLWIGKHDIEVGLPENNANRWCSLIPIGKRCCQVTTSGLKWNLDCQALEFGELVSTSNTYAPGHSVVKVECSEPLVWSMQHH